MLFISFAQLYYITFWHSKVKNKYIHKISHTRIRSKAQNKKTSVQREKQRQGPQQKLLKSAKEISIVIWFNPKMSTQYDIDIEQ